MFHMLKIMRTQSQAQQINVSLVTVLAVLLLAGDFNHNAQIFQHSGQPQSDRLLRENLIGLPHTKELFNIKRVIKEPFNSRQRFTQY